MSLKIKEASKFQERGTSILAYGELTKWYDVDASGKDDLGLGRWTYMRFISKENKVTQVVCRYSPCTNKKKDLGTTYQQH